MNCRQARKALENRLAGDGAAHEPEGLQAHLEQCARCQAWYDQARGTLDRLQNMEPVSASPGFTQQVLDRLPELSLTTLDKLVRLTRRAWRDPGFREKLRAEPRRTIEDWGLELPPDLEVVVVSPGEATLPTPERVALPLPAAGEGSLQEDDLRARLGDSQAAIWIQPELAAVPAREGQPRSATWFEPIVDRLRGAWQGLLGDGGGRAAPGRMLRPALVMVATLLVILGLLYVLWGDRAQPTPGTAAGSGSWLLGGVVLGAALLVAVLILWERKK